MPFSGPTGAPKAGMFGDSEQRRTTRGEPRRTVGLFSSQVPRELLHALGCTPARVFPTVGKPTAAEAYLPRNFCALNRRLLASFLEDGDPGLDAVIFANEDDAFRRLHDVWRASVDIPVWGFVDVPRSVTALAVERYAEILSHLAANLETRTGRSLTVDALREAMALHNQQRNLLAELKRHWLDGVLDTPSYRRLRRTALTQDPEAANGRLRIALEDLVGLREAAKRPLRDRASRHHLLLLAELEAPSDLVRLLEAHGAQVVAEDADLDERDLAQPVSTDAESVAGLLSTLAQAYLAKPPGPRMRDMPRRLGYLTGLVEKRDVQAAICAYDKFCDLYLTEFPTLKTHLEGLGVPVLLLELEDDAISGQHRTRVEAFLEMLKGR